jgi:hypothetical protein
VKRLLALIAGGLGLRALLRRRRRRPALQPEGSLADELREKLAESRAAEAEHTAAPQPEADVADRRRDVHDRARGAIDDLS